MPHRVCFALDLVDDAQLIAEYEEAHAPGAVWQTVTQGIRSKGFLEMEIWRTADRLFMIAMVTDDWPRAVTNEQRAVNQRWEGAMDKFQRPLPHADVGEKWVPMSRIYTLEDK